MFPNQANTFSLFKHIGHSAFYLSTYVYSLMKAQNSKFKRLHDDLDKLGKPVYNDKLQLDSSYFIEVEKVLNSDLHIFDCTDILKDHRRSLLAEGKLEEYRKLIGPIVLNDFEMREEVKHEGLKHLGITIAEYSIATAKCLKSFEHYNKINGILSSSLTTIKLTKR